MYKVRLAIWALRIGVFGTFLGHGLYCFTHRNDWLNFLAYVGIEGDLALNTMTAIGVLDLLVAAIILIKPFRFVLYWAVFWTFSVALIRPLTGQPILEFVERSAFIMAPLALIWLMDYLQRRQQYID